MMKSLLYIVYISISCVTVIAGETVDTPAVALPPVDIVVSSNLRLPKEQSDRYLDMLRHEAFECLSPLRPVTAKTGTNPKDGAAEYRLIVEHKGTLNIGNQINGGEKTTTGQAVTGGTWSRTWWIDCRQDGSFQFRLMHWDGKYTEVDKWTGSPPKGIPNSTTTDGKVIVATRSGVNNDVAKCPVSLADAQKNALNSLVPPSMKEAFFSHAVQISDISVDPPKDGADPKATTLTLTLQNKMPWDIKMIEANVSIQGKMYSLGTRNGKSPVHMLYLTEPLHGGEQIKTSVDAIEAASTLKPSVIYAQFLGK